MDYRLIEGVTKTSITSGRFVRKNSFLTLKDEWGLLTQSQGTVGWFNKFIPLT